MTFLEAWENIRSIKEENDDAAIGAIFTGINVADDFWDNFILVCNNKEGLATLLKVSPEKIASWPPTIQQYLEKSKAHANPESKEKTHMLDTGIQNGNI
jgi:hypothetical protein